MIFLSVVVVQCALSGCAAGPAAALASLRAGFSAQDASARAELVRGMAYLRVACEGRVALLVLGHVDAHPHGPIEVWYSAQGEVLRLQNGRLAGAAGTREEWRSVRLPVFPDWTQLAVDGPYRWQRVRDLMPGYRSNLTDTLELKRTAPPARTALIGLAPASLTWFEEQGAEDLPPARYALDPEEPKRVAYGEQCLSRHLCLTWQRWPVKSTAGARG